jgi:O-antigen ligase
MLFPGAAGWLTAPLILVGLILAIRSRDFSEMDRSLLLALGVIPLAYLINMAIFGGGASVFERPGHLLRAYLIYYAVSRLGISRPAWFWAVTLAAWTCLAIALYGVIVLHETRIFGLHHQWNAVPFGNFSLLLGMLSGLALVVAPTNGAKQPRITLMAASGLLAGLIASLLSGSRGGWLSMPILLMFLVWQWPSRHRHRRLATLALLFGLVGIGLWWMPQSHDRLSETSAELTDFWRNPHSETAMNTSSGQRLVMWRWALEKIPEHPLLGFGVANFPEQRAMAVRSGELPPYIATAKLANVHNELINTLITAGLLGAAALVGFWVLTWRCLKRPLTSESDTRYFADCGLMVVLATGMFSMTEGLFGTSPGTKALMLLLAFSAGGLGFRERQLAISNR